MKSWDLLAFGKCLNDYRFPVRFPPTVNPKIPNRRGFPCVIVHRSEFTSEVFPFDQAAGLAVKPSVPRVHRTPSRVAFWRGVIFQDLRHGFTFHSRDSRGPEKPNPFVPFPCVAFLQASLPVASRVPLQSTIPGIGQSRGISGEYIRVYTVSFDPGNRTPGKFFGKSSVFPLIHFLLPVILGV